MDIGVPSIRNLFKIKSERAVLWMVIGVTSIPLHLLYNSAVYNSIAANNFVVTLVTSNHFDQPPYSSMTEALFDFYREMYNITNTDEGLVPLRGDALFRKVLEKYDASSGDYEDLTPRECTQLYNTDFMSSHRNVFLITKDSFNATHNSTLLNIIHVRADGIVPSSWMCDYDWAFPGETYMRSGRACNPSDLASDVSNGSPWLIQLPTEDQVEISGCKSEKTSKPEKWKVQLSLGIMAVVICCNIVKASCMIIAVVRSREPTLVTLGDAMDSFLRIPDQTTVGMCFADRRFVKREWRRGRTGPRQWKRKGVQRWWASASKTRWITCNFLCLTTIGVAAFLLQMAIVNDRMYWNTDLKSMWTRGFGKVNSGSLIYIPFKNINQAILLANLPQTILSFLYLTYNSLFTCMLSGHEWSLFSHHHRTLRVTSPRPGQRSTYWLQLPYTYAIPLMTLSGLLHWLTSQSFFLASVEMWDPLGGGIVGTRSTVGYSCIAIIFVLALGVLALLTAAGMGCRQFAAETTTVGSCSAAISAACHAWEDPEVIIGKKVCWGDVGIVQDPRVRPGVRHLTFSSERVGKPIFGGVYAERGRGGG
ncbi:hypothetical protein HOY82DRAFT_491143 [Tuber indicum]|nr:hypothetical protein HOY82DRAFT_491143 [Tuber indicum]